MHQYNDHENKNDRERAEQRAVRRETQQTITVAAALTIGLAAIVVSVLAALTTSNIMDTLQAIKSTKCT